MGHSLPFRWLLRASLSVMALTLLPFTGGIAAQSAPSKDRATAADHQSATSEDGERFTATAVNMAAMSSGPVTTPVSIVISRWSTDAERDTLVTTLREQGASAVLEKLKDMPRAGSIAAPGSVGQEVHFARRLPGANGGERVILITDRPMGWWELTSGDRTTEYPFTLVELRIGSDGKGEGKASVATKVMVEPESNTVALENWGTQPVALQNVRREK